jgi:hypothetical protein
VGTTRQVDVGLSSRGGGSRAPNLEMGAGVAAEASNNQLAYKKWVSAWLLCKLCALAVCHIY